MAPKGAANYIGSQALFTSWARAPLDSELRGTLPPAIGNNPTYGHPLIRATKGAVDNTLMWDPSSNILEELQKRVTVTRVPASGMCHPAMQVPWTGVGLEDVTISYTPPACTFETTSCIFTSKEWFGDFLANQVVSLTEKDPLLCPLIEHVDWSIEIEAIGGALVGATLELPYVWSKTGTPWFSHIMAGRPSPTDASERTYGLTSCDNKALFSLEHLFVGSKLTPLKMSAYSTVPGAWADREVELERVLTAWAQAFKSSVPVIKRLKDRVVKAEADIIAGLNNQSDKPMRTEANLSPSQRIDLAYFNGLAHLPPTTQNQFSLLASLNSLEQGVETENNSHPTRSHGTSAKPAPQRAQNRTAAMRRLKRKFAQAEPEQVAFVMGTLHPVNLPKPIRTTLARTYQQKCKAKGAWTKSPCFSAVSKQYFCSLPSTKILDLCNKVKLEPELVDTVRRRFTPVKHTFRSVKTKQKRAPKTTATT